jgi:hypothetical protein
VTLPSVDVDSYNLEIEDDEGFIGDKANKGAFRRLLDAARDTLRRDGEDPLAEAASDQISKKKLDAVLAKGDPEAAAVIQSAIETFAQHLSRVIQKSCARNRGAIPSALFLAVASGPAGLASLPSREVEFLLRPTSMVGIELRHNDLDEAGLIGAAHLLPPWRRLSLNQIGSFEFTTAE